MTVRLHIAAFALVLAALFSFGFVYAQEDDTDLRATIRAAILSDPRSGSMTDVEIEGIVQALSEEAGKNGVTAADISWRPIEEQPSQMGPCGETNEFLCSLTEAFGFTGSDLVIPVGLGVSAAFLLFVLGMMMHRHGHHPVSGHLGQHTTAALPPAPPVF